MQSPLLSNLIFFFAFFIAFSLIELFLVYLLFRLARRYWEFVTDKLLRWVLHHALLARGIAWGSLIIILGGIAFLTPLFSVLEKASSSLKSFAGGMIAVIALVYLVITRRVTSLQFEKKLHRYLYGVISLILYTVIILLANRLYEPYQQWVQSAFVDPAKNQIQQTWRNEKEKRLLTTFRDQVKKGECRPVDYTPSDKRGVKHFIYIITDPDLADPAFTEDYNFMPEFTGLECTDGKNIFLLRKDGSWMEVIETD